MNTAEKIAEQLVNNGPKWSMDWTDVAGRHMDDLAAEAGGRKVRRPDGSGSYRWTFPDGSGIVACGAAWDIAAGPDCFCWEGAGHTEDCERRRITHHCSECGERITGDNVCEKHPNAMIDSVL